MADEGEVKEEVKKEKEGETPEKKHEEKKVEEAPKQEMPPVKKEPSGGISLKPRTDSLGSQSTESDTSATSMGMKRQSEYEKMMRGPKYQNTYRLDPKRPFKPRAVYKMMEEVVLREVEDFQHYESFTASKIVQNIAAEVRTSVKLFNFDRYKICVLVILGEKKFQGYQCAFRALWDQERDGWTTYFYQCRTYFLSCTCYCLYHD